MAETGTERRRQEERDGVRVSAAGLRRLRVQASTLTMPPPGILCQLFPGAFRARYHGRGLEFHESRHYQAGDDFRSLDWRVTARSGKLHTKLFQEEREQRLMLVLDAGPSMHFGSRNAFKWVVAARLAALIAWLAVARGDRLGGLLFGTTLESPLHPPASGETVLNRLFRQWALVDRSRAQEEGLATALGRLRTLLPPGSLVLLLSDFRQPLEAWRARFEALARHNEVAAIHLYDPLEADLPAAGRLPVSDGRRVLQIDSGDVRLRRRYHQAFEQRQRELGELFRHHRSLFLAIGSGQDPGAFLRQRLRPGGLRTRHEPASRP